ncbi:MAG: MBL fold metallo-hydrolase [Planctomycetota bacterium]|jgi:glyoxylase-like metal-dependent hydrolase (beta-lactamase superfamily II)
MRDITVDELTAHLAAHDDLAIIDIRDAGAFADWHIPGAVNVPVIQAMRENDAAPLTDRAADLPRDRPVLFVCNAGTSSQKAASFLEPLGFETQSLVGGMRSWSLAHTEARPPLEKPPGAVFLQVRRNGKGCLSYLLGHDGAAAVIDPCVDATIYTDLATREGLTIGLVIETHVHADHISRARDLCVRTGADHCLPRNERVTYPYRTIEDGQALAVGGIELRAIATPGHTGESTSYLVGDEAILTGDTLFVESVGRPDLEKGDAGAEAGARALYASLHERLLTLSDDVCIYPAHTSESIGFDGAPIAARLGDMKSAIPLLQADEPTFIADVVAGIGAKPPSFEAIIQLNEGKADLGEGDPVDVEAGPNRCAVAQGS